MLAPIRTAAPTIEPVSLDDARKHLRLDDTDQDPVVAVLISAATAHLDGWAGTLGRALLNQTWTRAFGGFCDPLRLPLAPVTSISSVTYYDGSNTQRTLATSVYQLLTDGLGPKVALKPDQAWPTTYGREDAVTVTFVAGYGATADKVPAPIRAAMLLMIGHWFENREAVNVGNIVTALPMAVDALLGPYRRVAF